MTRFLSSCPNGLVFQPWYSLTITMEGKVKMRWIRTMVAIVLMCGPLQAQQAEIQSTIASQIEAFRTNDFDTAFTFASPTIQGIFGTPDNFGGMVRSGYPMVMRPTDTEYLELREISGRVWQKVRITDPAGVVHVLDYQMIESENGWKINGVQILTSAEVNV